jgi:hypothetical protein
MGLKDIYGNTLDDQWKKAAYTYLGVTVADYPNMVSKSMGNSKPLLASWSLTYSEFTPVFRIPSCLRQRLTLLPITFSSISTDPKARRFYLTAQQLLRSRDVGSRM